MQIKRYVEAGRKFLTSADYRFLNLANRGFYRNMPDDEYLKRRYRASHGVPLNLEDPKHFNEKLQWLKLYNHNPRYVKMVDKYLAREVIAEKVGSEHLVPLLGVWDDPDEIDFDALPDQFVLKCNHNSGTGMCICRDKSKLNIRKVKRELRRGIHENYYLQDREWPYKDVPRKIICEKFLIDQSGRDSLLDYKFFCFDGEPKIMYISNDGGSDPTTDFFDMEYNHLDILARDPQAKVTPEKPACFQEMRDIARILAEDIPFLRVDFYYINGTVYVGEMTFFHNSGMERVSPESWSLKLGSWITLRDTTVQTERDV